MSAQPPTIQEIRYQLADSNPETRLYALAYLAHQNLQTELTAIIGCLRDEDKEVRATAAWSLDLMGNLAAIPALADALFDQDYHVRTTAGWALVHLGAACIPYVAEVLDSENDEAAEMAFHVLRRLATPEASAILERYRLEGFKVA